jgi:hypothetical protein
VQQQQVAVRDLADRAAKMESAASELAIKADAKLKEADAYSGSGSRHELRVVEVFGGSISLYSLATGKTSCLTRELQQEKLVVVDLRHGVGPGVSRCSDKYFSTDSHAAVQLFPQYPAVGGTREEHQ